MNYDPIESCPYDPVHRIMRSRLQVHLTKCRKNFPNASKKQCPYDARHIINEIEFNYHISICPQRESVWHYKIVENKEVEPSKILPIDSIPAAASTEENWEEDGKYKSYDPMKHTENRPVIRTLAGAQKAERKVYQRRERLRISQLEDVPQMEKDSTILNNSNQRPPSSMKPTIPKEASEESEQEYKPLRRPNKLPLNASKMSDFSSLNDSAAVNQTLNTVKQNESLTVLQEKSNAKQNVALQPRDMCSYAAALKRQQNSSIESDYDVVIESVKFDVDKLNNSSFFNHTIDENLIKVSKTVEKLAIGDEGHKVQSDSLDKTLKSLKTTGKNKSTTSNGINNSNNNVFTTERRSLKCAANFTNLKYH